MGSETLILTRNTAAQDLVLSEIVNKYCNDKKYIVQAQDQLALHSRNVYHSTKDMAKIYLPSYNDIAEYYAWHDALKRAWLNAHEIVKLFTNVEINRREIHEWFNHKYEEAAYVGD